MRIAALALLAWVSAPFAAQAGYLPTSELTAPQPLQVTSRDVFTESEHYCLALGLFFEGGSTAEPEIGLRHIARVITERAKADRPYWGGNTICGVVFYKRKLCQFSFACLPEARRTPKDGPLWRQSVAIADEALAGHNEEPDTTIRYYMNAKLSALKYACLFRKEFVPVVKAGTHEFFREATPEERAEIGKRDPEDCKRYAESLKPKKKLGKKGQKNKHHMAAASRKKHVLRTAHR
jgi:hypothetical protein